MKKILILASVVLIILFWKELLLYFIMPLSIIILIVFVLKYLAKKEKELITKVSDEKKKSQEIKKTLVLVSFRKNNVTEDVFEKDIKQNKTIKTQVVASNKSHLPNHKFKKNKNEVKYMYVQSYGEKLIAEYLYHKKIHFIYDKTMKVLDKNNPSNSHNDWIRPDFFIPHKKIIIEYWGMAGDKDYDKKRADKKSIYRRCINVKLINIYKNDLDNLHKKLKNIS